VTGLSCLVADMDPVGNIDDSNDQHRIVGVVLRGKRLLSSRSEDRLAAITNTNHELVPSELLDDSGPQSGNQATLADYDASTHARTLTRGLLPRPAPLQSAPTPSRRPLVATRPDRPSIDRRVHKCSDRVMGGLS